MRTRSSFKFFLLSELRKLFLITDDIAPNSQIPEWADGMKSTSAPTASELPVFLNANLFKSARGPGATRLADVSFAQHWEKQRAAKPAAAGYVESQWQVGDDWKRAAPHQLNLAIPSIETFEGSSGGKRLPHMIASEC